jgi:hypothetical protein
MKKYNPFLLLVVPLALFAFRTKFSNSLTFHKTPLNSGGVQPGKTGAPGEGNCTSCHSGSVLDGKTENVLALMDGTMPVTTYSPNKQYTVLLSMKSNPFKKGFQATVLNSSNSMAGSFSVQTNNTNNTSINGTSKKYANHTSSSNTAASAPIWTWTWTAPAAGTGDVKFYLATNSADNKNNTNGDLIYLSQHLFSEEQNTSELSETERDMNVQIAFLNETKELAINFELTQAALCSVNVFHLSGKSVYSANFRKNELGKNKLVLSTANFGSGLFVVNFFIDNKPFSRKIYLE